jgi:GTPase SAR1 family protein
VVYDVCNRDTFIHVGKWLEEAKANGPPSLLFILVGNKSDKQPE